MPTIHDPAFLLPPRPPFRWGTSPFRVRGTIYRDELAFDDRAIAPLGMKVGDLAKRAGDTALEAFVTQRFDTTGWYDLQPILWIGSMVARARGVSFTQQSREAALSHAEAALSGFTGIMLRLLSNEAVASWVPRISTWYHDFGAVETRVVGPRHVRGVRTGLPSMIVLAWAISATSFAEQVLTRAGAKAARAHALEVEADGARDGCALYRVSFEVRWGE